MLLQKISCKLFSWFVLSTKNMRIKYFSKQNNLKQSVVLAGFLLQIQAAISIDSKVSLLSLKLHKRIPSKYMQPLCSIASKFHQCGIWYLLDFCFGVTIKFYEWSRCKEWILYMKNSWERVLYMKKEWAAYCDVLVIFILVWKAPSRLLTNYYRVIGIAFLDVCCDIIDFNAGVCKHILCKGVSPPEYPIKAVLQI